MMSREPLHEEDRRLLPSVHEYAKLIRETIAPDVSERESVSLAREALSEVRNALAHHASNGDRDLVRILDSTTRRRLSTSRRVINATGVILHTNLGRAPLAKSAIDAISESARTYTDLELDLETGKRSQRGIRVERLLSELIGSESALVVNNGAAAVTLAVAAVAGTDRAVVISRAELVEIGGGFRVPDVIASTGARLLEVGTSNRTHLDDYKGAVESEAGSCVILKVHQSNFRTIGFTTSVDVDELCELGVPVIHDIGSGSMFSDQYVPQPGLLSDEPLISKSLNGGSGIVCFSGDKLLGGPQAGVVAGREELVSACRRHQLARALRVCKLTLSGLEATLALHRDPTRAFGEVPVLRMLTAGQSELERRAAEIARGTGGEVVAGNAPVGGGTLPLMRLQGPVVRLQCDGLNETAVETNLRTGRPPVLARFDSGHVVIDPRTVADDEVDELVQAVRTALGAAGP